ncbi:MAG: hypothetical protein QXL54_01935 [Candidatus Bathyarchaeia archaeon]
MKAPKRYKTAPAPCRKMLGANQNQLVPPAKCNPAINQAKTTSVKDSAITAVRWGSLTI